MAATVVGLVSAVGAPNPGVARVLEQFASRWAAWDVPVVLALCAEDAASFAALARAADSRSGVAGLELHLGCQDLRTRRRRDLGAGAGHDPDAAMARVAAARAETDLPILAKVSADAPDPGEVAAAAVEGGADAICAIDGLSAAAIDPHRRRPMLGSEGRLSGPAILPVALRAVGQVVREVRVPIVGIGGVATLDDVLRMLQAGASAVGMATAVLADPSLPGRLSLELESWCRAEGVGSITELVGAGPPARSRRSRRH
jgi:dihydroorotate dehydrogenase (NAD+) catalytic subunit